MKNIFAAIVIMLFQYPLLADWIFQTSGTYNPLQSVHFVNQNIGYIVGLYGTILKTTNGGTDWIQLAGVPNFTFRGVFFTDQNNGWAVGTGGVILHTTDGGELWFSQNSGTTHELYQVVFTDSLHGWISGDWGVMLYTPNGGTTWISLTTGLNSSIFSVNFINSNYGWAVGALGKIIHTTNGGSEWLSQVSGTAQPLYSVFFKDESNGWVVGDYGNILHTTDGGNVWFNQTSGSSQLLEEVQFTSMYNGWVVGTSGTILHTTDGGNNWFLDFDAGWNNLYSVSFVDSLNGWAVGDQGMICKYSTAEIEIDWCNLQDPPEYTMSIYDSVEVFARVFVDGITILPGPCYDILAWIGFNTENTNPSTWSNWIPAEYQRDVGANDEYSQFLANFSPGTYYYASRFQIYGGEYYYGGYPNGFWDGLNNISGVLTVSDYHVIQWCNLEGPATYSMTEEDSVEVFAQVFSDGITNLPGQGEGILAWIGISSENTNPAIWNNWISAEYKQDVGGNDEYSNFLPGLDSGTYYYASRFQIYGGEYYYGGYPDGFWDGISNVSGVLTVTPISDVKDSQSEIFDYTLNQNHPNPFNPSTTISFEIPEPELVTLKVYDALGKEIITLVNEEKPAGKYKIDFDAGMLSSGIYLYQLRTGNFVETKKMVLIK